MAHQTARLNRLTQEVVVLASTAKLLNTLDLDEILSKTLSLVTEAIGAERATIFLFSRDGNTAERFIINRDLAPERSQMVVDQILQEGLAGWVYRHKQSALINDTLNDARWVTLPDAPHTTRCAICVPFILDDHIQGIMTLEHSQPNQFNHSDMRMVTTVTNQAAVSLRNAQLFEQVETHQRQLRAVLHSTLEPILTITPQCEIRMANHAALALIGRPESEVVGQPLASLQDHPLLAEIIPQITAGSVHIELQDDNEGRDYVVRVSGWRAGDGTELGRVIVFNDITALKNLSRLKTQMLQMTSHDLKNPLGVIMGYTEMLLMELEPDSRHFEFAADIARVTQRMLDMVGQLLSLERIETLAESDGDLFDPLALVEDVVYDLQRTFDSKGQTLASQLPEVCPALRGDPVQLREAFKNLVENASKYSPEGGHVTVHVEVNDVQDRFEFRVEDNGYGIPEHLQTRIFERFYRARQPGAEDTSGTGLGLSLVKSVIQRHHGDVWFRSAPGEGSTFGFWLPFPDEDQAPQETQSPDEALPSGEVFPSGKD
ncbi:MAG: GAF domain-containing protein [Anaerolineae bacterium]|nr:GAF domain-containing protein [Anaerolineae bacterium]